MVAVGGFIPVGYYKDEAKSAATFRTIDGRRWSIPGDFATVNEDGSIHLLGRGSVCINTGGEKVFPEEVEEALKTHPSVRDAVVVGIPDERFGETICGVVEAAEGAAIDGAELRAHVTGQLAAYKAPRNVVVVDTIGRAANGKVDYAPPEGSRASERSGGLAHVAAQEGVDALPVQLRRRRGGSARRPGRSRARRRSGSRCCTRCRRP